MPCFRPIKGFRSVDVNPSGKRSIVFDSVKGYGDLPVTIPCGQCIGCRLERSRQWAVRCVHEASLYDDNCFITLTYDDSHLPKDGSVHVEHFQLFFKRLRESNKGKRIRYFHCGEYGELNLRPHYHACIFGFNFDDRELLKVVCGNELFTSKKLGELWPFGFSTIGGLTFESAAYVARYVVKKVNGRRSDEHYKGKLPEYVTMSRRPGIGKGWLEKYESDLDGGRYCVVRGVKMKVPKFYMMELEKKDELSVRRVRAESAVRNEKFAADNTVERLDEREFIVYERLKQLERKFENGT